MINSLTKMLVYRIEKAIFLCAAYVADSERIFFGKVNNDINMKHLQLPPHSDIELTFIN